MKKNDPDYKTLSLYTVQKINNKDQLYGAIHGSSCGDETLCGIALTNKWYVLTNAFDGEITCKKCLKRIKQAIKNSEPF